MLAMCVSTISLTITKSKVFSPLRNWVIKRNEKLGSLLSCPYCMSHWVATFYVIVLYIYSPMAMVTNILFIDATITIFAIISLATIITGIVRRATSISG
ncbi:DUF1360 domain-containing protein [Desulfocucumis palustris]|uniref:DUF1360 domain-containing protein n=1 Tax=Desulfocucumis palustris TaxID=1898651 RepID=UPI0035A24867